MDTLIDQAFFITMSIISILASIGLACAITALWQQRRTPPTSKSP